MRKVLAGVMVLIGVLGGAQPSASLDSLVIVIDGSSTVAPVIQAASALFTADHPAVRISVGISGTSGGFRRFLAGELDIACASRPIRSLEMAMAQERGIEYIELLIGFDGVTVAVSRNTSVFKPGVPPVLTLGELALLWSKESEGLITRWSQLGRRFQDGRIVLSGAASTSGTFDFFTELVNGRVGDSRADYFGTEEDQLLAELTGAEPFGLTYFGFAYLEHNRDRVQAVAIDPRRTLVDAPEEVLLEINRRRAATGKPPLVNEGGEPRGIIPTLDTIGAYLYPLTRPLFIYVHAQSAQRPAVAAFVEFLLTLVEDAEFMLDVGYVPPYVELLEAARQIWAQRITGSAFAGQISGLGAEDLLAKYKAHASK